jgi:hypothetical protein
MKKLFTLSIVLAFCFGANLYAQTAYFTEGFDSTYFPSGSTSTQAPTDVIAINGTWTLYWSFRTNSSSGSPIGASDLRIVKTATVTTGGFCYVVTPTLNSGVGKISFYEGRGNRLLTVDKSTDNGQTWVYVDTIRTVAKVQNPLNVNDAKANRIRISNQSTSDADIDEFTIYKYTTNAVKNIGEIPNGYVLEQNYPNPFNPTTMITFGLAKASNVKLTVYNTIGQEVKVLVNGSMSAGYHSVDFKANNLPSGVYIYRLTSENESISKKMILNR